MNIFEKIHALLVSNEVNVWHFPKRCDGKPFVYWLLSENNPNGHDFDDLVEMVEEAYSHIDPLRKPLPERVVEPTCGFVPPTPGYAACTREKGHDGPCAHPFADQPGRDRHDELYGERSMKWISVNTPPLKVGDTREIRRFLFRPKTLNGETRWLEWSTWKQEAVMLPVVGEGGSLQVGWVDVKWMGPYNSIQHFLADHPWPRPPRPKPASASV